MNILEEIAGKTRERIEEEKRRCSPAEMKGLAEELLRSKKHGGAGALTGADNAAAGGCFYRALAVPGMSTYRPDAIDVAIPRKAKVSTLPDWPELNVCYFTDERFDVGIETVEDGNNRFRIYDIEKTVVDIVFYREKVGIEETKQPRGLDRTRMLRDAGHVR